MEIRDGGATHGRLDALMPILSRLADGDRLKGGIAGIGEMEFAVRAQA